MKTSFYSEAELEEIGLSSFGEDVKLSRKTSIYSPRTIDLGNHVRIDDFCILSGKITIGDYVHIGAYSGLFGADPIVMEDFSGLSSRVSIYTVSEDYLGNGLTNPTVPDPFRHPVRGPVTLEKHVIVGAGSVILPQVTIGEGTAVGALAVVQCSIQPWKVASGPLARPKQDRRRDLIEKYEVDLRAGRSGPEGA
jgi:acetyltransferase-like isoleucine patch superfamily enzyme